MLDVYNQPAGHVEKAKRLIEAAKREALEETGFEVEPTPLLGLYTYTPENTPRYHLLSGLFYCKCDSPLRKTA
jgi:8-oxo-dGTP pyrophosphatase MutT (NUDIX family)